MAYAAGSRICHISIFVTNVKFRLETHSSAGAPQWVGITALAEQSAGKRLGFLNGTFYRILKSKSYSKGLHDITRGNNAFSFEDQNGKTVTIPGYKAGPGWDPTTGVGTPKVSGLVELLVDYQDKDYDDGKDL